MLRLGDRAPEAYVAGLARGAVAPAKFPLHAPLAGYLAMLLPGVLAFVLAMALYG
jgi:hypothetical protein